jgi:hypothetical protein
MPQIQHRQPDLAQPPDGVDAELNGMAFNESEHAARSVTSHEGTRGAPLALLPPSGARNRSWCSRVYDSPTDGSARWPHTAFDDPDSRPGAPPRAQQLASDFILWDA